MKAELDADFKAAIELMTNSTAEDSVKNFEEAFSRAEQGLHVRVMFKYLPKAIVLIKKAKEEDRNNNYEDALRFYENGIEHYLYSLKHETSAEKAKKIIRAEVMKHAERSEEIKALLRKLERQKHVGDSEPIEYWMDEDKKKKEKIRWCIIC